MPKSATEKSRSNPVAPPRLPTRKYRARSLANILVATISANAADAIEPPSNARSPARVASTPPWSAAPPLPTLSTSAHATPSGYGKSDSVTSARRSGMEYMTPNTPPSAHIDADAQYGKPVHQPMITSPGRTKMIDDSVPAADATVWTMLFSWIVTPLNLRSTAIEMTAAGIEVEKVNPALSPKNTFAAVNSTVINTPRITPRMVSSFRMSDPVGWTIAADSGRVGEAFVLMRHSSTPAPSCSQGGRRSGR